LVVAVVIITCSIVILTRVDVVIDVVVFIVLVVVAVFGGDVFS
jgi:hypothetical protein